MKEEDIKFGTMVEATTPTGRKYRAILSGKKKRIDDVYVVAFFIGEDKVVTGEADISTLTLISKGYTDITQSLESSQAALYDLRCRVMDSIKQLQSSL